MWEGHFRSLRTIASVSVSPKLFHFLGRIVIQGSISGNRRDSFSPQYLSWLPIHCILQTFMMGMKRLGHEANHRFLNSSKAKNVLIYKSTPHTLPWLGVF